MALQTIGDTARTRLNYMQRRAAPQNAEAGDPLLVASEWALPSVPLVACRHLLMGHAGHRLHIRGAGRSTPESLDSSLPYCRRGGESGR